MNLSGRLLGVTPYLLGVLLIAGIVHIVAVLIMPRLAPNDAFARVQGWAAVNELTMAPASASTANMPPFLDPSLQIAICRFDVSQGPVRIAATVDGEHLLSMAFQSRTGQIFHSLTDRAALRDKIDVVLLQKEDLEALEANDSDEETPNELRLTPPTKTGLVIVRALAETPGGREAAQAQLRKVRCAAELSPRI